MQTRLTSLNETIKKWNGRQNVTYTKHLCDCGSIFYAKAYQVASGEVRSCGCLRKDTLKAKTKPLPVGKKFGRLTLLRELPSDTPKRRWALCLCDCGSFPKKYRADQLGSSSNSCGCLQKEAVAKHATKHGMNRHPIHNSWSAIKQRCDNPKATSYDLYGGRGITYCKEWESFENFLRDMGDSWVEDAEVDRIDYNGNYCKDNCRWVKRDIGNHNKRKPSGCTSGYKGVYFDKKMMLYVARISFKGTTHQLFKGSEYACALSYDNASEEFYGDRPNGTVRE